MLFRGTDEADVFNVESMISAGMEEGRKDRMITLRLSQSEYDAIKARAGEASMSVSDYLRSRALGRRIMSTADKQTINELRRLGGLVKHLYNEGKLQPDQSGEALHQLISAVKRIGRAGE